MTSPILSTKLQETTVQKVSSLVQQDCINTIELANHFSNTNCARYFDYSDEQRARLRSTFPGNLEWNALRRQGYILVPSPAINVNLLEVAEMNPRFFAPYRYQKHFWFQRCEQKFSRKETMTPAKWLILQTTAKEGSAGCGWHEQRRLLGVGEYVPSAVELAYVLTLYQRLRGFAYFLNEWVRTSSEAAPEHRSRDFRFWGTVIIGANPYGLMVSQMEDTSAHASLGVAVARTL